MEITYQKELLSSFVESFNPPFTGSVYQWCNQNVDLPQAYRYTGRFDVSLSPYLVQPFDDLLDPRVKMVNLIGATQIGKSLLAELYIPFIICNDAGPVLRLHQSDEMAHTFMETRLLPLLRNTPPVAKMLAGNRNAAKKDIIIFPHMAVKVSSAKESMLHGQSIRFLLLDEAHIFLDAGTIDKALARTTAFAGRRKIVISSQPNRAGSELEKYFNVGMIYEWEWLCPKCKQYQPYRWNWQRLDGTFAGVNWTTILNPDGEQTNIGLSAKTAWLECFHCCHKVTDTQENRRLLNDTSKYLCIKNDGDPSVHSYTVPQFVNPNISFADMAIQYMNAKRTMYNLGLDEDMVTFVNQVLGRFYKAAPTADHSKIMRGDYLPENVKQDKEWVNILTADVQRKGSLKFYIVRSWNRSGRESRRLDFGVVRTWEEIEALRVKWNVQLPCVGLDCGDGEMQSEVFQACVLHNQILKLPNGQFEYLCWAALKGDQKISYDHPDKVKRYYSPIRYGDPMFPADHRLKKLPAKFWLWSNFSIKTIFANLRDNKVPGVKWVVNGVDKEYEAQLWSEGLKTIVKKNGETTLRWVKTGEDNHWYDAENMNLVMAIQAGIFTPTAVNEEELKKLVDSEKPEERK